jgi:hypothetical protein
MVREAVCIPAGAGPCQNNGHDDLELLSRHLHPSRAITNKTSDHAGFLAVLSTAAYNSGDDGDDRWLAPHLPDSCGGQRY